MDRFMEMLDRLEELRLIEANMTQEMMVGIDVDQIAHKYVREHIDGSEKLIEEVRNANRGYRGSQRSVPSEVWRGTESEKQRLIEAGCWDHVTESPDFSTGAPVDRPA